MQIVMGGGAREITVFTWAFKPNFYPFYPFFCMGWIGYRVHCCANSDGGGASEINGDTRGRQR